MTPTFQERISAFVAAEILGREKSWDSGKPRPPLPVYDSFRRQGLANWWLPKRYGGLGLPLEDSVDVVSELAYGDAGLAATFFISILATTCVDLYGTEKQKRAYLLPMVRRRSFAATLGSEEVGSELLKIRTTARREGAHYVLDGAKLFSTNTDFAEFVLVLARASDRQPPVQFFLVPRRTPGLKVVRRWPTMGMRASGLYEVKLERCRVPADSIVGPTGLIGLIGFNASRTLVAATGLGVASRIRDVCLDYAARRDLRSDKLARNAVFAAKMGQMEAELTAMRALCKSAAREFDAIYARPDAAKVFLTKSALKSVISAKMICGQLGWKIASEASTMFGGMGFTDLSPIGKLLRDIRAVSIVEQGDDVIREVLYYLHVLPERGQRPGA